MIRLSANLGFLWTELSLPDAIRAAKSAGFEAVECHWPYTTPATEVSAALAETGLPMVGLNTDRGDLSQGENGVAALPGRETEARSYVDAALEYAVATDTANIHVMAGFSDGSEKADETFVETLRYACEKAAPLGKTILIEPLNRYDAPNYHLQTTDHVRALIAAVGYENLQLMFDVYHVQIMQGDVIRRLEQLLDIVGHIQIAAVPDRGEPDQGEIDYRYVLQAIAEMGWTGHVGAEYKPRSGSTDEGLDWMARLLP